MRISTDHIIVEDSFSEVEKKAEKEEVEQESLTEEHNKHVFNIVFEYAGVQNNMGEEVESKFVNEFDGDLMLIEEWIQKYIYF